MKNKVLSSNHRPTSQLRPSPRYCNYLEMLRVEFHLKPSTGLLAQYVYVCMCWRRKETDRQKHGEQARQGKRGDFPLLMLIFFLS